MLSTTGATFSGYPQSRMFEVGDLLHSDTAERDGIDNTPNFEQLKNLELTADVLNRIYYEVGPFHIESGFRSLKLNAAVGGSPTSKHLEGIAADIVPEPRGVAEEFFFRLLKSSVGKELGESYLRLKNSPPTGLHISLGGRYGGVSPARIGVQEKNTGQYVQMTEEQIKAGLKKYGLLGAGIALALSLGGAAFLSVWYMRREGII